MSQPPVPAQQQPPQQEGELQGDLQRHEQQEHQHQQQQQQQYQHQQQQQQMPLYQQTEKPQFLPQGTMMETAHVSPMWPSKMILRVLSMIFCLVLIGVCAGLATNLGIDNTFAAMLFCPPAGVAFIWNLSETIFLCARRGHRGIPPGVGVGVDLVLWLGYIVSVTLFSLYGMGWLYYSYAAPSISLHGAVFAFGILEILVHFTLFVIACYETDVRNRNTRAQRIIYVQAGPDGTIMYPPNFPMGQTYQQPQPTYAPGQPPMQQYQQYTAPQQNHLASSEVPTTTTTSPPLVSPPQNQTAAH